MYECSAKKRALSISYSVLGQDKLVDHVLLPARISPPFSHAPCGVLVLASRRPRVLIRPPV